MFSEWLWGIVRKTLNKNVLDLKYSGYAKVK